MKGREIPNAVAIVVGDVLGSWAYNHTRLDTLFAEKGAPGEPPEGNCVKKCQKWLQRCNQDPRVDGLAVLGGVLEEFMLEVDGLMGWGTVRERNLEEQAERVRTILAQHGLSYRGGRIYGAGEAPAAKSLIESIREKDLDVVEEEFEKAMASIETDPRGAVTAACALLESLFKCYIEDKGLEMPKKQTIGKLWPVVQENLGLKPGTVQDDDVRRVLSGLTSIVDGIGALRTHAGDAHGQGRTRYRLEPRHARLAVNAAHTAALCVLDTWGARDA